MWQDYLITTGGFVLIASLLTMVRLKDRWYIPNALILGTVLGAYGVAFVTMSMWLSASVMFVQSVLWTMIALQRCRTKDVSGVTTEEQCTVCTPPSGTTTLTNEWNSVQEVLDKVAEEMKREVSS